MSARCWFPVMALPPQSDLGPGPYARQRLWQQISMYASAGIFQFPLHPRVPLPPNKSGVVVLFPMRPCLHLHCEMRMSLCQYTLCLRYPTPLCGVRTDKITGHLCKWFQPSLTVGV